MKQTKLSIKWKLLAYLTLFVLFMIALLWLLQTVFLDEFYQNIKTKSIVDSGEYIEENLNSEDIQSLVDEISIREEVSINILDTNGGELYSSVRSHDSIVKRFSKPELKTLYLEAQASGGSILKGYQFVRTERPPAENPIPRIKGDLNSIVYMKIAENNAGERLIIALDSIITPLDGTINTLRVQLIYITGIFVLAAASLALILSRKIANPIIQINAAAKVLARKDYSIRFGGGGYSEVVELRNTLNTAVCELAKTETLQRELIANMSHDLRTPLTMIIGYGEVIRDLPGENTPENIQVIIDEANRLNRLVSDVLDISKLQSGTQNLDMRRLNLTGLVESTIKRCAILTEKDGYSIEFSHEEEIYIMGDELKLSQVIYNLIGNAITHSGKDKRVRVSQALKGSKVRIVIADSGEGIPQQQLEHIWERYYKLNTHHKRASVGTGLGLSIVKSIVELHGGSCGVESALGEGSEFWFELEMG